MKKESYAAEINVVLNGKEYRNTNRVRRKQIMNYILSPSILSCDFSRLGEQIIEADQAGAQYLHIDVMDGMFVPEISFGMPVIRSIRKVTDMVFDVHLMIEEPGRYVEAFANAGADIITVHVEACKHLDRTLQQIRQAGKKAGVVLNPATPINTIEYVLDKLDMVLLMTVNPGFGGQKYIDAVTEKITAMRRFLDEKGYPQIDIEVDGGVNMSTIDKVLDAGANVIVAGSAVFNQNGIRQNVRQFLDIFEKRT